MDGPDLAIVIPALNEAATIGQLVTVAAKFGTVIVVDDGSTDETGDIARSAEATVIRHDRRQGYEKSIESGFALAQKLRAVAVVTMDADGEHDPSLLARFRELLVAEGIPLVLGVRPNQPRLAEYAMGKIFRWRYGITDALCGMKGYRTELYRENGGFDHVEGVGTELAVHAIQRGVQFLEVPVSGGRRQDKSRYGQALRANLKIVSALVRVMRSRPQNSC